MAVKRIVTNIATPEVKALWAFYADLFELELVMDQGWIATLATGGSAPVQLSIASEGGAGAAVPDISIEVTDIEAVYTRATARGIAVVYPLTSEPWGVRRFFIRDPAGKLLNVMAHTAPA